MLDVAENTEAYEVERARRRWNRIQYSFALFSLVLAVLAALGASYQLLRSFTEDRSQIARMDDEIQALRSQTFKLQREITARKRMQTTIGTNGGTVANPGWEYRMNALESAQLKIGQTIMASPEKALELPMIRRDLMELKTATAEADANLRREIDRMNGLLLALIAALGAAFAAEYLKRPGPIKSKPVKSE